MNVVLDNTVCDEIARLQAVNVMGGFEHSVRGEILDWILSTPVGLLPAQMEDVIKQFWNERLN